MTTNEAIMYLAIGFMIIIGIWLSVLTYMVLKRHRDIAVRKDKSPEVLEKPVTEEEVSEPETPDDDETEPQEPTEEKADDIEPDEEVKIE